MGLAKGGGGRGDKGGRKKSGMLVLSNGLRWYLWGGALAVVRYLSLQGTNTASDRAFRRVLATKV